MVYRPCVNDLATHLPCIESPKSLVQIERETVHAICSGIKPIFRSFRLLIIRLFAITYSFDYAFRMIQIKQVQNLL